MTDRTLILGPPGTGKTERLTSEMEQYLTAGTSPDKIAFVSFTKSAVAEARRRISEKFGISGSDLPHLRTLHSMCFRELGLRRDDVFGKQGIETLEELTGEELTGHQNFDAPTLGERGDALMFLDQYSRNARITLEDAWHGHGAPLDWHRLVRFTEAYKALRGDRVELDFTDMLEEYVASTQRKVDIEVAIIDEAQDLTSLQWEVVEHAFADAHTLLVAGDDDQSLYSWAGADVNHLLKFHGEHEVLGQSHRLPRRIYELAQNVLAGIEHRFHKIWQPAKREGEVEWLGHPEEADLSSGTWLLLARTRRQLASLVELARGQGVVYTVMGKSSVDPDYIKMIVDYERERRDNPTMPIWHDALTDIPLDDREYLLAARRRGETLTVPRVRIETIHGAKGAEAESVLLLTDLNERVRRGAEENPDAEQRVLYVAITRARERLFLVTPRSRYGYQL